MGNWLPVRSRSARERARTEKEETERETPRKTVKEGRLEWALRWKGREERAPMEKGRAVQARAKEEWDERRNEGRSISVMKVKKIRPRSSSLPLPSSPTPPPISWRKRKARIPRSYQLPKPFVPDLMYYLPVLDPVLDDFCSTDLEAKPIMMEMEMDQQMPDPYSEIECLLGLGLLMSTRAPSFWMKRTPWVMRWSCTGEAHECIAVEHKERRWCNS